MDLINEQNRPLDLRLGLPPHHGTGYLSSATLLTNPVSVTGIGWAPGSFSPYRAAPKIGDTAGRLDHDCQWFTLAEQMCLPIGVSLSDVEHNAGR